MPVTTPTVFLADDEANIVTLLEMELQAEGFTVVTATDGISALKKLRDTATLPDLALLDWNQVRRLIFIMFPSLFLCSSSNNAPFAMLL